MAVVLEGGCRVSTLHEGDPCVLGSLKVWNQIGPESGAEAIALRILEFEPGKSPDFQNREGDEVETLVHLFFCRRQNKLRLEWCQRNWEHEPCNISHLPEVGGFGVTMTSRFGAERFQIMTNEEMQRAMDFIVEMEAKSSAKMDALTQAQKEGQAEADQRWKRADERWARTEEGIRALLAITEMHEREIQSHTQQILSIGETTKATDDRLNALINVVERQISNGRNGN